MGDLPEVRQRQAAEDPARDIRQKPALQVQTMQPGNRREYQSARASVHRDQRLSHVSRNGITWLGRFLFCPEVIACGRKAAQTMQKTRMLSPDARGLLSEAQTS